MPCRDCALRATGAFSGVKPGELDYIESYRSEMVDLPSGAAIIPEHRTSTQLFTLYAGWAFRYKTLSDGRRQILNFLLPGDFLGLSMSDKYRFSAEAVDDVTACRFDRTKFNRLLDSYPSLLRRLHQAASSELNLAQDHMVLLGRRNAEQRLAAFVLSLRDRLKRLGGSPVTVPLAMSRQDIADYLGLTIETVSRTVTSLAASRTLLVVPGGVRIMDAAKLEALAA